MPTITISRFKHISFITLSLIGILILHPCNAQASSDPQSATASATATILSTTPTTSDTTAPSIPILIRPEDGTYSSDNRREFVWRMSSDQDSNTVFYTLYLNGVATYLGISNIGNSSGVGYTAFIDNDTVRLTPTNPLPDGEYTWYVTASDLSGNSSRSTSWFLTIDTTPPSIELTQLEDYSYPIIDYGSNFDIEGPRSVDFSISTEPFARVQISIQDISPPLVFTTAVDGLAYLYQYFVPGIYEITILSTDRAGNTSFLHDFTITISQAEISIPVPDITIPGITEPTPSSPPKTFTIPYSPLDLPSLPATISRISTRENLPAIIYTSIAVSIFILLFLLYKRRYNLLLLNDQDQPIKAATIYHATQSKNKESKQVEYILIERSHGKLFVPNLARYSTLTIAYDGFTVNLSISVTNKRYLIKIG